MAGLSITRLHVRRGLSALARRVAAVLALVGLLVHAGLPLLHQPRAAAGPLDDRIVVCSGFGVKVVHIAQLEGMGDDSQRPSPSRIYYCPLCLAQQMAGAAVLPDVVALPAPGFAGVALSSARPAPFVAPVQYSSLRARAPPSIA